MVLTLPSPTRAISGSTTELRLPHRNPYFVGAAVRKARQDGRLDWLAIEEHPFDARVHAARVLHDDANGRCPVTQGDLEFRPACRDVRIEPPRPPRRPHSQDRLQARPGRLDVVYGRGGLGLPAGPGGDPGSAAFAGGVAARSAHPDTLA